MKFLIVHSVPLNGGDEALLRATVESLSVRWPGSEIAVLCRGIELCRKHLPDLRLAPDLECVSVAKNRVFGQFADRVEKALRSLGGAGKRFRWLDSLTAPGERRHVLRLYQEADIVLSSPGGFFHDHYPIEDRLRGLEAAVDLGKPVIIFAQSIGPFWIEQSRRRISEVFNRLSRICVRDSLSRDHLLGCGVSDGLIEVTADAAFLWARLAPELFRSKSGAVRKIAMCFRVWPLGDTTKVEHTVEKAARLCRFLLSEGGRELLFISTCQGIPGYVDDSEVGLRIVNALSGDLQARCRVDRCRHSPRDLIRLLGECDAFVGMRLHGCLLAMLGGTPAMGLGYESKTEEIYRQLGFQSYQTGFQSDGDEWIDCARRFLTEIGNIRAALRGRLECLCAAADRNLDAVSECLSPGDVTSEHMRMK